MTETIGERFSIGRVLSQTTAAIQANLVLYLLVSALLVALPEAGGTWLTNQMEGDLWTSIRISNFTGATVGLVAHIAMIHAAMTTLSGKRADAGESLATGLRLFFPAFGISWLTNLGVLLGGVLLVVPGIILMTWWCVALPARIADGPGVLAAIGRSRELTKGSRWHIAGLFGLAVVGFVVLFVVAGIIGFFAGDEATAGVVIDYVLTPIITIAFAMVAASCTAAIWQELMRLKGGAQMAAEVFA